MCAHSWRVPHDLPGGQYTIEVKAPDAPVETRPAPCRFRVVGGGPAVLDPL